MSLGQLLCLFFARFFGIGTSLGAAANRRVPRRPLR